MKYKQNFQKIVNIVSHYCFENDECFRQIKNHVTN